MKILRILLGAEHDHDEHTALQNFVWCAIFLAIALIFTYRVHTVHGQTPGFDPTYSLEIVTPDDHPFDDTVFAEIDLGKKLFFEKAMSIDGTVACATCHNPKLGLADGLPVSRGVRGQTGTRSAPTLLNQAFHQSMFDDFRADQFEGQVDQPLISAVEMGNQSVQQVADRLNKTKYRAEFLRVFGERTDQNGNVLAPVSPPRIRKAMASFERTLIVSDTLESQLRRGMSWKLGDHPPAVAHAHELFNGKANCVRCHTGQNFDGKESDADDDKVANNGSEFQRGSLTQGGDTGLARTTNKRADTRKFKVSTLIGIDMTKPFMHTGRYKDLLEVMVMYKFAGGYIERETGNFVTDPFLDDRIELLDLSDDEVYDMVAGLPVLFHPIDYPNVTEPMTMPDVSGLFVQRQNDGLQQQIVQQQGAGGGRRFRGRR